jgi:hypothetical protein
MGTGRGTLTEFLLYVHLALADGTDEEPGATSRPPDR